VRKKLSIRAAAPKKRVRVKSPPPQKPIHIEAPPPKEPVRIGDGASREPGIDLHPKLSFRSTMREAVRKVSEHRFWWDDPEARAHLIELYGDEEELTEDGVPVNNAGIVVDLVIRREASRKRKHIVGLLNRVMRKKRIIH
jgi:hypothetical protein